MTQISITMPSNRNLAQSHRAIETALAFCEARDGVLIVSDNSRDPEKAAYWTGRSERLIYVPDAPPTAAENSELALRLAQTPFVMPMGDDDEIHVDPSLSAINLQALPDDVIGVKPTTFLFAPGTDLNNKRAYALDADAPGARLRQFFEVNGGDNTAFYSIFRTQPYQALLNFFYDNHPTRGSYIDWALTMALVVSGKILHDPSFILRYNISAWVTDSDIDKNAGRSYASVGLSPLHSEYSQLLQALDIFVFASRRAGGLSREALATLQAEELSFLLDHGFSQVLQLAGERTAMVEAARKGLAERNPLVKYLHGAALMDLYTPGLKSKYLAFLKASTL